MKTAQQLKIETIDHLNAAYDSLCAAQNSIASVRGKGMADIYTDIGDCYGDTVSNIIEKLRNAKATGIAEI